MIVKLLTSHHLEYLSLKGGCRGSSESTLVKMPHCWQSHATAHILTYVTPNYPTHLQTMDCWKTLILASTDKTEKHFSSLPLHDITKLLFTGRRWFCYIITLTFLCNIHCTVIFMAIKRQVVALFLFLLKHGLWAHIRTASLSTHTFCFRIEKRMYQINK